MTPNDPTEWLVDTLDWAATRDYAGYDYADGLSSRFLRAVPFEHRVLNLGMQELAKRSPVNIRPLLLIPKRKSFKGTGLFISANITAYEVTNNEQYRSEAFRLGRWLLDHRQEQPFGWGHNHRIQTIDRTIPRNTPSIVTLTYVTRALLRLREMGFELPMNLPENIRSTITETLAYERVEGGARINYRAGHAADYTIINANALGAALLLEVAEAYDAPELIELAEPIFEYVATMQTPCGGWAYADPAESSHLSMDNHHNGFVLESFLRRQELRQDGRYEGVIADALHFHRESLFRPDGAPNWDEHAAYPRDIHAASQGIITFTRAGDHAFAKQILDWTIDQLHQGNGRFAYRKGRIVTRRFTLMRWCQAWMARALATVVAHSRDDKQCIPNPVPRPV